MVKNQRGPGPVTATPSAVGSALVSGGARLARGGAKLAPMGARLAPGGAPLAATLGARLASAGAKLAPAGAGLARGGARLATRGAPLAAMLSARLPTVAVAVAAFVLAGCSRPDITDGRYQGMVEYDQRELAFETPGRVSALQVRRGQRIRANDVLARQDEALDREARAVDASAAAVAQAELDLVKAGARPEEVRAAEAQLASARAAEANAQTELARERMLVAKEAAPAAQLDTLSTQLAAATGGRKAQEEQLRALRKGARVEEIARASARLAQARQAIALDDRRLEKRVLSAPSDGVVQDVYLEVGEVAGAGVPVLAISDVVHPYADVFVPVPEVPRVKLGDRARLRLEGLAGEVAGTVELIHAEAEFTPRFVFSPRERPNLMVRVRVRLTDPDGRVHAGLPAYATFEPATAEARP